MKKVFTDDAEQRIERPKQDDTHRKFTQVPKAPMHGADTVAKVIDLFGQIAELVPNCVLGWQGVYDDDGNLLVSGSTLVSAKRMPKNMLGVKVHCDVDEDGNPTKLEQGRIAQSVASMAILSICDEYGIDLGVVVGGLVTLGASKGAIKDLAKVMKKDSNFIKNAKKVLPKDIYDSVIKPLEEQQDD